MRACARSFLTQLPTFFSSAVSLPLTILPAPARGCQRRRRKTKTNVEFPRYAPWLRLHEGEGEKEERTGEGEKEKERVARAGERGGERETTESGKDPPSAEVN